MNVDIYGFRNIFGRHLYRNYLVIMLILFVFSFFYNVYLWSNTPDYISERITIIEFNNTKFQEVSVYRPVGSIVDVDLDVFKSIVTDGVVYVDTFNDYKVILYYKVNKTIYRTEYYGNKYLYLQYKNKFLEGESKFVVNVHSVEYVRDYHKISLFFVVVPFLFVFGYIMYLMRLVRGSERCDISYTLISLVLLFVLSIINNFIIFIIFLGLAVGFPVWSALFNNFWG